jgi:signal transduction histidine kinase
MKKWLRRLWPDSHYGQLVLALLIGATVLQGINMYAVCYIQHSYNAELHKVRYDYDSSVYLALRSMSGFQREAYLSGLAKSQSALSQPSQFHVSNMEPGWTAESSPYADEAREAMLAALESGPSAQVPPIKTRVLARPIPGLSASARAGQLNPLLQTAIELDDGSWLEILQPLYITNRSSVWRQRFFILLESVLFSILLIWMIRRATRPLYHLGKAAEQFGRNPEIVEPIPASGSKEIREAAYSFNRMRERIRDNIGERNRMLEAMGHDLRTPLAKIQLRLDKIKPEELRDQFAANIHEIELIIEQGLELARSLQTSEETVPLDIVAFAHTIVDDLADQGLGVSCSGYPDLNEEPMLVLAKPTCLKRCLENLLTNAVKYAGNARMVISRQGEGIVIEVNDNGPGIPDEFLEKVFEPYYRLERSRNRNSGGTGLGLSIARNMVLLNNGSLQLKNRLGGGLTAAVMLAQTTA